MTSPSLQLTLLKPKSNFMVSRFNTVRPMANIPAQIGTEISPNSTWSGSQRIGFTQHPPTLFDGVQTFPDHGADGARVHVFDEAVEEGFAGEVGVVLFEVFFAGLGDFDGNEFVAAVFEAGDDVSA